MGGSREHDPLPLDIVGKGLAQRPLALEGAHGLGLLRRLLGGELILGRSRLELFQLQLQLVERKPPRRDALRRGGLMVENCTYGQSYDQCVEST